MVRPWCGEGAENCDSLSEAERKIKDNVKIQN